MPKVLDRSKHFGAVEAGVATFKYHQDNAYFDHEGFEVDVETGLRIPDDEKKEIPDEVAEKPVAPAGFPCDIGTCTFIAKTKGGLTAHKRGKH